MFGNYFRHGMHQVAQKSKMTTLPCNPVQLGVAPSAVIKLNAGSAVSKAIGDFELKVPAVAAPGTMSAAQTVNIDLRIAFLAFGQCNHSCYRSAAWLFCVASVYPPGKRKKRATRAPVLST